MIPTTYPTLLRRLVAVLTLATGGWVQAVALDCPMGLPANPSPDASAHAAHGPDAHAGASHESVPADEDSSTPHSDPGCMLVMGCGATGHVAPRLAGSSVEAPTVVPRTPLGTTRYATVFPTHEPPPPRLSA